MENNTSKYDVIGTNPQYFIKKGRRYIPVQRFEGFPAEGVFIVENDPNRYGYRKILNIGERPNVYPFVNVDAYREDIIQGLKILDSKKPLSLNDIANEIIHKINERLERESR